MFSPFPRKYLSNESEYMSDASNNFSKDTYVSSPSSTFGGSEEIHVGKPQTDPEGNEFNKKVLY